MLKIRLTYWWNGHQPNDVVEVDDVTARTLLAAIAEPVQAEKAEKAGKAGKAQPTAEKADE